MRPGRLFLEKLQVKGSRVDLNLCEGALELQDVPGKLLPGKVQGGSFLEAWGSDLKGKQEQLGVVSCSLHGGHFVQYARLACSQDCQIGMQPSCCAWTPCLDVQSAARPVCCWARLFKVAVLLSSCPDHGALEWLDFGGRG